ncbi:RNA pseudouridine synthase [Anaerolentibacter hominis]|uniref:RluA family pseudouridine synthase n=1 Tax=Anaerolentibacter hominis TaxID=3079009 RepID=UPI0031B85490
MNLKIVMEDTHFIVCEKPPGVPSQGDRSGALDMISLLRNYRMENENSDGIPEIYPVHRLDRPVGGVMVYAKTPFGARELSRQAAGEGMKKKYLAVVGQDLSSRQGENPVLLIDWLVRDGARNMSRVVSADTPEAKEAKLYYQVRQVQDGCSLLEVTLLTGRHHQIRVQLANAGIPIYGDTKYNSSFQAYRGKNQLALFAYELKFRHPKTGRELKFRQKPEYGIFRDFTAGV